MSCISDLDCYFDNAGSCTELECRGGSRNGQICDPDAGTAFPDGCPGGVCDVRVGTCDCVGGSPGVIWQGFNTIIGKVSEEISENQVKFDGKQRVTQNKGDAPGLLVTVVDIDD